LRLSRYQWAILLGILLIAIAGVAVLSGLEISRGNVTDWLWYRIWSFFGYLGVMVPITIGLVGLYLVLWGMEQPPRVRWPRVAGVGVTLLGLEGFLHLLQVAFSAPYVTLDEIAHQGKGGGYLGGWLAGGIETAIGRIGALGACLAIMVTGGILISGLTFDRLAGPLLRRTRRRVPAGDQLSAGRAERAPQRPGVPAAPTARRKTEIATPTSEPPQSVNSSVTVDQTPERMVGQDQPGLFYGDAVRMAATGYSWRLPSLPEVLEPGTEGNTSDVYMRQQVEIIEHTLASFGAPGRVVEINPGPVITQFGVEPQYVERRNGQRTKVKVGQINSLADDLALALAAQSIRIEAPVPGKGYIGIEVPNSEASVVSVRDVMESPAFGRLTSGLKIALGQDVSGHAVVGDLTQMPHLLIAGATGSGKSVCVNAIVACLLIGNTPDQLRLLMVDPKRVELTGYNGVPHLLTPVIVDLDKVVGSLQWVTREMDTRYRRFAEAGVRNMGEYNRQADERLPYIVVIIDELADLMLMAPEETERAVCRMAQMARATGIHLVIATQRPSVDVVTGLIKANFPARIAFAVASSTDSRVILDSTGAERLLGRGDMLIMLPDTAQPQRLQGSYVSDRELRRLVEFWRRQRVEAVLAGKAARARTEQSGGDQGATVEPEGPPALATQQPLWEEIVQPEAATSGQDELYDQAVAIAREMGKASVSLLQRRLRIGYTRAARLVEAMEAGGIVGPHPGGSRQREVLAPDNGVGL
jgi:S-DNA-T family DNA segregation ATPase FtsK/SpoIIIE